MSCVVAQEPFSSVWPEANRLAELHHAEVEECGESDRPHKIDVGLMEFASRSGLLRITTARESGMLVGYLTWTIMPDAESAGLLVATQGAWFVAPLPGLVKVAARMWNAAIRDLELAGVSYAFPHHYLTGRGATLGKFFERQGAKFVKKEYTMKLNPVTHNG